MKIAIICNLAGGAVGGQTAKTKQILGYLGEHTETEVYDLYPDKEKGRFLRIILRAVKMCRNADVTLLILNIRGTHLVLTGLKFFGMHKKKPIYDVAIGGQRQSYAAQHAHFCKMEKITARLFVETSHMAEEFHRLGVTQAEVLPNCKDMDRSKGVTALPFVNLLKLCTFSRVVEDKGIDTAVEITRLLNESGITAKLDIFGPVDPGYQEKFDALLRENRRVPVAYEGTITPESSGKILSAYHILLMPTRFTSEGFPGTFLDAMEAGLVILAPRLENFRDIVIDGENGFLLEENTPQAYLDRIRGILESPGLLKEMREKSREMSRLYTTEQVLGRLLEEISQ